MNTKKIICLVLAVLLLFGAAGCSENPDEGSEWSVWYEDQTSTITVGGNDSSGSGTSNGDSSNGKNPGSNNSGGGGNSGGGNSGGGNSGGSTAEVNRDNLDFGGATITLLREWEPYKRGRYTTWDNFINNVEEAEKKYNVNIVEKKWSASLANEMLAGVEPEGHIYLVGSGNVYGLARKGYITSFNDAMKKTGIDMTGELYADFGVQLNNINGNQYSVALGFNRVQEVILYNKTMTKKAGYDIDKLIKDKKWTWDKMTEIAKKVTQRSASGDVTVYGIGFDTDAVASMALSNGGHIVYPNSSGKFTLQLSTPATQEALQQIYDWINKDKVATYNWGQKYWSQLDTDFYSKKIAMLFGSHNAISMSYSRLTDEYGIAYIPMGPRSKNYVSILEDDYSYVVPSTYSDMAPELLLLLEELHQLADGYTIDKEFRDQWIRYFKDQSAYDTFKSLHDGRITQVWDGTSKVRPAAAGESYASTFGKLFEGKITPGAYIDTYQSAFQTTLNDLAKDVKYTGNIK